MTIDVVEIACKYGQIKGGWSSDGLKLNFNGALFEEGKRVLDIEFSVPYSFMNKYGKESVLEEIKSSVEGYMDTDPRNLKSA